MNLTQSGQPATDQRAAGEVGVRASSWIWPGARRSVGPYPKGRSGDCDLDPGAMRALAGCPERGARLRAGDHRLTASEAL
jgi:hypothetical protein